MKRLTIALDDAEYEALAARAKAEDRTVRQQAAHEIKAAANHASWPFTWPNTGGFWPWRGTAPRRDLLQRANPLGRALPMKLAPPPFALVLAVLVVAAFALFLAIVLLWEPV